LVVDRMLVLWWGRVTLDLGSGDGRIVVAAAQRSARGRFSSTTGGTQWRQRAFRTWDWRHGRDRAQ
jgi:hypothetical protein